MKLEWPVRIEIVSPEKLQMWMFPSFEQEANWREGRTAIPRTQSVEPLKLRIGLPCPSQWMMVLSADPVRKLLSPSFLPQSIPSTMTPAQTASLCPSSTSLSSHSRVPHTRAVQSHEVDRSSCSGWSSLAGAGDAVGIVKEDVTGEAGTESLLACWGEGRVRLNMESEGDEGGGVVVDPPKGTLTPENEDDDDGRDRDDRLLLFAAASKASRSVCSAVGCERGGAETESEQTLAACPTRVFMGSSLLRVASRPGV